MTTINQVCKAVVIENLDQSYIDQIGFTLNEIYYSEYGSWNGTNPKACRDYLQGLPSVCTVPFWNDEILELLAKAGITRKSEAAKEKLIDAYWLACGNAFYNLIK